jgi:hypothetical protein
VAAIEDRPYDVPSTIERLRDIADSYCLGPSTACIVNAASDRKIPSIRLNEGNLVQLGYGARQHRIWTAETDQTSAISESISSDKDLKKPVAGLQPAPRMSVDNLRMARRRDCVPLWSSCATATMPRWTTELMTRGSGIRP